MVLLWGEMFITGKCRPFSTSPQGCVASPEAWAGAQAPCHVVSPLHRPTCLVSPAVSYKGAPSSGPRRCPARTAFLDPLRIRCRHLLVHFLSSLLPGSLPPELALQWGDGSPDLHLHGLSLCSRPGGWAPQSLLLRHEHRAQSVQFSCSVVSDSLWLHGPQHARPPCPSPTSGACSNSCPSSW